MWDIRYVKSLFIPGHCLVIFIPVYTTFMANLPQYVAEELAIIVAFQSNCNSSGAKILVASYSFWK